MGAKIISLVWSHITSLRKHAYAIYTAMFHGCKNINFHMKNCDIFLIFAQKAVLTSTHNLCF